MNIRKQWLRVITTLGFSTSPEAQDEAARKIIRAELQTLYARTKKLEALLAEPERLRNIRAIEQLANEMQKELHRKRHGSKYVIHDSELTDDEKVQRDHWLANKLKKEDCRHLKGAIATRWGTDYYAGPRYIGQHKDYNVSQHTFIGGKTRIRCLYNCGFESWTGDANWEKAKKMAQDSTNTPSSSEGIR